MGRRLACVIGCLSRLALSFLWTQPQACAPCVLLATCCVAPAGLIRLVCGALVRHGWCCALYTEQGISIHWWDGRCCHMASVVTVDPLGCVTSGIVLFPTVACVVALLCWTIKRFVDSTDHTFAALHMNGAVELFWRAWCALLPLVAPAVVMGALCTKCGTQILVCGTAGIHL
jgi:hypothetical protein